jgi:spermidine/putrescine-binding protein
VLNQNEKGRKMQRVKFIDQMAQGKITRRKMMQSAAAFGVGALALPKVANAADVLTCLEWSGYDSASYIGEYVAKHGGAPDFSIFSSEEEALAKIRAGFKSDVMHPCNYSVSRFVNAGVASPIDTSRLSHWNDIFPMLKTADGVVMNGEVFMAPADWGNSSIAYRPDLVDDDFKANPSWGIMYDEKYKNKVSHLDSELAIIIGLMVEGKKYEDVYNISGEALAAAAATWGKKAVDTSLYFWTDPAQLQQSMATGEVVAAYAWNDLIRNLTADGIPIEYAVPKEGLFTWFCGLTLLNTGDADEQLAYDFIDAWLAPETGKVLIEESGYGHANAKSFEIADPKAVKAMGVTDPEALMASSLVFKSVSDEVQEEHTKVWNDLKALKL